ncbi:hypothetical protein WN943_023841 [Citrus x changshan-huyou]
MPFISSLLSGWVVSTRRFLLNLLTMIMICELNSLIEHIHIYMKNLIDLQLSFEKEKQISYTLARLQWMDDEIEASYEAMGEAGGKPQNLGSLQIDFYNGKFSSWIMSLNKKLSLEDCRPKIIPPLGK